MDAILDDWPELRLFTAAEAGELLRMSARFIERAAQRGELGYVRLGRLVRFTRDDLLAYIRSRHAGAEGGDAAGDGVVRVVRAGDAGQDPGHAGGDDVRRVRAEDKPLHLSRRW